MNLFFLPPLQPLNPHLSVFTPYEKVISSSIRLKDFSLLQEIQISEKIKTLEGWSKYMNPILKVSDINIASASNFEYKIMKKEKQYSLVEKTKYKSFLEEMQEINNKCKNKKEIFIKLLQYYHSFLPLLDFLERNRVVSLSCELQNIYLNEDLKPILQNISACIFLSDSTSQVVKDIYFLPISVHVIKYLNEHNCKSISSNNITEICSQFIEGLYNLHLFTMEYLKEYAKICHFSLQPYINKSFSEKELTLDVNQFSVSIMFLILIMEMDLADLGNCFKQQLLDNIMYNKKHYLYF